MTGQMTDQEIAQMKEELKKQIVDELKDERVRAMEESRLARTKQKEEYAAYVAQMKESSEPWVDVTGWTDTEQGVKVELEWNDSFVDYLKAEGITGADEDQIVQQYITLLLRDMADQMDDQKEGAFE